MANPPCESISYDEFCYDRARAKGGEAYKRPRRLYFFERSMLAPTSREMLTSALGLVILLSASCGGPLYKVKPLAKLPAMPATSPTVNLGSLSIRAKPLLTDEETQELFESNLRLAGLLPIRVEIVHNSGDAIDLGKIRFKLHDTSSREWKFVSARQAIGRILKANGVFVFNPNSRKTFEKEFRSYELELEKPLTHDERRRQGLIIFLSPQKEAVTSPHGLVLAVEGLPQRATLNLN